MKVIDLLNKIANNEEVPKKIKHNHETYIFKDNDYLNAIDNSSIFYEYCYHEIFGIKELLIFLNSKIEIIEKPKKIEKIYNCCMETSNEEIKFLIQNINDLSDTLNEIIDYINKGE